MRTTQTAQDLAKTQMNSRTERGNAMKVIVSARNLTKRYQLGKNNFVDALRGASVEVGQGEMVAIMGPSGCGKSTMLHILGCLDTADSGEIWLNDRRIDKLGARATTKLLREEIGFIFQGFNLVSSMTALENVALAAQYAGKSRRDAEKSAREALAGVGLAERADHRPTELSGGQQQRVAIARALVNKPKVIMGDEPTGNLDSASSSEVVDMMREINLTTGTTFVLVTHDPDVAEACDRVIHMRDGVVTGDATLGGIAGDMWGAATFDGIIDGLLAPDGEEIYCGASCAR
jgi:putative ABC transport system ATP-binding protein